MKKLSKQKIQLIRSIISKRKSAGFRDVLGDSGRVLKAKIYGDIAARHPGWFESSHFLRVIRAVNNLIGI